MTPNKGIHYVYYQFVTHYQYTNKMRFIAILASAIVYVLSFSALAGHAQDTNAHFTIVAHRGASGYLPEHTLEAATLAYAQHPDFIEQDVVITKDDIPVVLHDIHLETVSDVEARFPTRKRQDGRFYARDFTLNELRQLTVHERTDNEGKPVFTNRYSGNKANFKIATLAEHFELIRELNRQFDQSIGVYPEIKSPSFHLSEGVDASKIVINALKKYGFAGPDGNSYLQCFDFDEIKRIRETLNYKGNIVMLIGENSWGESDTDFEWLRTEEGMEAVSQYANGIGPWIGQLFDKEAKRKGVVSPTSWLEHAHKHALTIHPYTYRQDALPEGMNGTSLLNALRDVVKAHGVFTDQVPPVREWREQN